MSNLARDWSYAVLPEIKLPSARLILNVMADIVDKSRVFFAKNAYLTKRTGYQKKAIIAAKKYLLEHNYIKKSDTENSYELNIDVTKIENFEERKNRGNYYRELKQNEKSEEKSFEENHQDQKNLSKSEGIQKTQEGIEKTPPIYNNSKTPQKNKKKKNIKKENPKMIMTENGEVLVSKRITKDWIPNQSSIEFAQERGFYGEELNDKIKLFVNYYYQKTSNAGYSVDWNLAFESWIIKACEFKKASSSSNAAYDNETRSSENVIRLEKLAKQKAAEREAKAKEQKSEFDKKLLEIF